MTTAQHLTASEAINVETATNWEAAYTGKGNPVLDANCAWGHIRNLLAIVKRLTTHPATEARPVAKRKPDFAGVRLMIENAMIRHDHDRAKGEEISDRMGYICNALLGYFDACYRIADAAPGQAESLKARRAEGK